MIPGEPSAGVYMEGGGFDAFERKSFLWWLSLHLGHDSPVTLRRYSDGPHFAREIRPGLWRRVTSV